MSKVLTKLRSGVDNLSSALQRIAHHVLEQPDKVLYYTVTELAEASGSSEGSVIRFCQNIGFSGFQDFKLSLALDLAGSHQLAANYDRADASLDGLMGPTAQAAMRTIEETTHLYEPEVVHEVAGRVLAADRIDVYGVAASGIIAEYFAYKFVRLGLQAQAFTDPHLAVMNAVNLDAKAVAIGVSSSGSTLDTLKALTSANEAGAYTVAVTNRLRSPLSKVATRSLLASPPESPLTGGDIFSKISQLLILEVLMSTILRASEAHRQALERTAKAVVDKSF